MTGTSCRICGDGFASAKAVRDHTWDVHGACHRCGEGFDDRGALYTHWLEAHGDELSREARKRAETKVGDRTVCPVCDDRFASAAAVHEHAWDAHEACSHCGERFEDREQLYAHLVGAHEGELSRNVRDRIATADVDLFGDRLANRGFVEAVGGVGVSRRATLAGGAVGLLGLVGAAVAGGVFGGGGRSFGDHPATAAIGGQPRLGPPPDRADGTIVAFEDPSCPSCARFERSTFPALESRLVEAGALSFVYRGIPVVQPWGEPASLALESTYARDEAAFWALKAFYFRSQARIGSRETVMARTREFLSAETDLTASAVLADVEEGTHRDAVDADIRAARDADVPGTPTFYLFEEGTYVTEIVGPQPYEVFANALGL